MRRFKQLLSVGCLMIIASLSFSNFILPSSVSAAVPKECKNGLLGLPNWYEYLDVKREDITPNNGVDDPVCRVVGPKSSTTQGLDFVKVSTRIALAIIDILLRIGGIVAFGFIVYSGFRFVTSQGNADQEKAARETAINAVIGMVITIFAIVIVTYIGNQISNQ